MNVKEWKCKDGRVILIKEMSDSHLLNTVAFLRRNVDRLLWSELRSMSLYMEEAPDGAADCCEMEANRLLDMEPEEVLYVCVPSYRELIREMKRRGLPKEPESFDRGPLMPKPAGKE